MVKWIQDHKASLGVLLFLVIAAAIVAPALYGGRGEMPQETVWYYDLNTSTIFEAADGGPCIKTKSGERDGQPAGVRAYVFSCSTCDDTAARFVGYIETLEPAMLSKLSPEELRGWYGQKGPPTVEGAEAALRLKRLDDKEWVEASSALGQEIASMSWKPCSGGIAPIPCISGLRKK